MINALLGYLDIAYAFMAKYPFMWVVLATIHYAILLLTMSDILEK